MGPLGGVRIIEMAGIGPAPFCAMLLTDLGAEVLRLDRTGPSGLGIDVAPRFDLLNRGRRSLAIDLKRPDGSAAAMRLIGQADALIEGFRPGVMERLGLGPDDCFAGNPRLVETLRRMAANQDFPASLLFTGPQGVGKFTLAALVARTVHCLGHSREQGEEPCGECKPCRDLATLDDPGPWPARRHHLVIHGAPWYLLHRNPPPR